ncbi:MAG: hypothetical protein N3F07_01175 [Candidatus Micrarchaeota archaeon]|nr:hypothetical protein [Candidatus Micrarchaeota archaeon]
MEELERLLAEKLGGRLQEAVDGKIREFGGLLTRKAALSLLCRQHGIEVERPASLGALPCGLPFSLTAKVERIYPMQTYDGGGDRSLRVRISDSTGSSTLVLWNEQADFASAELCPGDTIFCSGAYLKGSEIFVARRGSVKIVSRAKPLEVSQLTAGICTVEGVVREVEPDYAYIDKKSGQAKSLSSFLICDGSICRRAVVWEYPPGAKKPNAGDFLRIENALFKSSELHVNRHCRIVRKSSLKEREGTIEAINQDGEGVVWRISGSEFRASLGQSLQFLGIAEVPSGILPSTALLVKGASAVGKHAVFAAKNGKLEFVKISEEKKQK